MHSRKRFYQTVNHKNADRIPLDGWFAPSLWNKLKKYCGITEDEQMLERLGIDFRTVVMMPAFDFNWEREALPYNLIGLDEASYLTKKISKNLYQDEWGVQIKVKGDSWNYHYHPLQGKKDFKNLKMPELSNPARFEQAKKRVEYYKEKYVLVAGVSTLFRQGWILRGFVDFLQDLILNRKYIEELLDRLLEYFVLQTKMYIDTGIDVVQLLGDLGTQESTFLSPDMWREIFKPYLKELIDATRRGEVRYFIHSDGNIEAIIPDLIEIGIELINPIQPECMNPVKIKRNFGKQITLYGTISLQKTLSCGSVSDVRNEIKERIKNCGADGGLILSAANAFTVDIPVENILAMYDAVQEMRFN